MGTAVCFFFLWVGYPGTQVFTLRLVGTIGPHEGVLTGPPSDGVTTLIPLVISKESGHDAISPGHRLPSRPEDSLLDTTVEVERWLDPRTLAVPHSSWAIASDERESWPAPSDPTTFLPDRYVPFQPFEFPYVHQPCITEHGWVPQNFIHHQDQCLNDLDGQGDPMPQAQEIYHHSLEVLKCCQIGFPVV